MVQSFDRILHDLEEHSATIATSITLRSVLHRVGRLCGNVGNRAAMSKEQDLDRNGQASVQSDDNDKQNARGLRINR